MRDEFLSEEDLDLKNLSWDELMAYWEVWFRQAQATNEADQDEYSHGVMVGPKEREQLARQYREKYGLERENAKT